MTYIYKNITGRIPVKLLNKGTKLDLHCIKICNTAGETILLDLYIHYSGWREKADLDRNYISDDRLIFTTDPTGKPVPSAYQDPAIESLIEESTATYHIFKNKPFGVGANLLLEGNILLYDQSMYDLYIALPTYGDNTETIDVILNVSSSSSGNINSSSSSNGFLDYKA